MIVISVQNMSSSHNNIINFNPSHGIVSLDHYNKDITVENKIHIRLKKRNTRKSVTTVEGLDDALDFKKLISHLRRKFNCGGSVIVDEDTETKILQFTGDQREILKHFLTEEKISDVEDIVVHGC